MSKVIVGPLLSFGGAIDSVQITLSQDETGKLKLDHRTDGDDPVTKEFGPGDDGVRAFWDAVREELVTQYLS